MSDDWAEYLESMGIDTDKLDYGGTVDIPDDWFHTTATQQFEIMDDGMNDAERHFARLWRRYGDKNFQKYETQYGFHPKYKFRADFAWPEPKVIVEIMGMTGAGGHPGHHRSIPGYMADCRRKLRGQALGWEIIWIPTFWLDDLPTIKSVIKDINTILRYR